MVWALRLPFCVSFIEWTHITTLIIHPNILIGMIFMQLNLSFVQSTFFTWKSNIHGYWILKKCPTWTKRARSISGFQQYSQEIIITSSSTMKSPRTIVLMFTSRGWNCEIFSKWHLWPKVWNKATTKKLLFSNRWFWFLRGFYRRFRTKSCMLILAIFVVHRLELSAAKTSISSKLFRTFSILILVERVYFGAKLQAILC